jgi:hypothetical protein
MFTRDALQKKLRYRSIKSKRTTHAPLGISETSENA